MKKKLTKAVFGINEEKEKKAEAGNQKETITC